MSGMPARTLGLVSCSALLLLALVGCSSSAAEDSQPSLAEPTQELTSALGTTATGSECNSATAGGGWVNTFMPQSNGTFSVELDNFVSAPGNPPELDAVIGLSNGPAGAFTALGPIVRFNPNGNIDARNGDHYEGGFPYTTGVGPFAFRMDVNVTTHHYDVWVKHNDSPAKPFQLLASNFAFRTEQSGVTRLDNVGRFVDGAQGSIDTCGFSYSSPTACQSSTAGSWVSQAFPAQTGTVRLELDATATSASIDAVIGVSLGMPSAFTSLGPIVRFNPNGTFDARNGGAYRADTHLTYAAGTAYHIVMDVNVAAASYSATITAPSQTPVTLARDYAFRSEQAHVSSLDHLGQFVDTTPGTLSVCALTVVY
jgi:hypothetical protein